MKITINTEDWPLQEEIKNTIKEETKQLMNKLCKEDSWFLCDIVRGMVGEIRRDFIDDVNLRNLIISEFIKSMSDDEKKKLFLEALLLTRK